MIRTLKAKRIEIFDNSKTKYSMSKIKKITGCDDILNGGIFNFGTLKPLCHLKVEGKVLASDKYTYWGYGFNSGSGKLDMVSQYSTYDNYICCVAMIKDGAKLKMNYNSDMGGKRGRSAIGTKKDGSIVLFCSKDGSSFSMTPESLQDYMLKQGCVNALMLDGGGSSQGNFAGVTVTSSRIVSNYILIWEDKTFRPDGKEPTVLIKKGSKGTGAKWTQSMLQRIGYRIAVDGDFGSASDKALREFQKYWGLEVDGLSGSATRTALKNCVNAIESNPSKALRVFTRELGRNEADGEDDKYILWYNAVNGTKFATTVAWCAISASWANRRGGVNETRYPNFSSCSASLKVFEKSGLVKNPKTYKPKSGDLIYFDWDQNGAPEHVGMVFSYDGKYVETIEGNSSDAVRHKKYLANSKYISKYVEIK